jgi:hypothetical protein
MKTSVFKAYKQIFKNLYALFFHKIQLASHWKTFCSHGNTFCNEMTKYETPYTMISNISCCTNDRLSSSVQFALQLRRFKRFVAVKVAQIDLTVTKKNNTVWPCFYSRISAKKLLISKILKRIATIWYSLKYLRLTIVGRVFKLSWKFCKIP